MGQPIAETIVKWDDLCRFGDFDISDCTYFIKLGVVTWSVKLLAKRLGMAHWTAAQESKVLDEWRNGLRGFFEKDDSH